MPGLDLLLFAELQAQRLRRDLISAAPRQTFTAGPRVEVYRSAPRRKYSVSLALPEHGTVERYQHLGCKCYRCAFSNLTRTKATQPTEAA